MIFFSFFWGGAKGQRQEDPKMKKRLLALALVFALVPVYSRFPCGPVFFSGENGDQARNDGSHQSKLPWPFPAISF